ncbi:MAG: tetratricopeptide repeat protein [Parachlamydiales bacterium]|jgi:type III secretion system low calcium response chaperone LcrH/SycD
MEEVRTQPIVSPFSPEAESALYAVAFDNYNNGHYDQSLYLFKLLTWQNKEHRAGWMGYAASLQMTKQYEDAIAAYGYAALLDPNDPYVHFHAAECYFALKNLEKAMQALNSALAYSKNKEFSDQLSLLKLLWAQGGI